MELRVEHCFPADNVLLAFMPKNVHVSWAAACSACPAGGGSAQNLWYFSRGCGSLPVSGRLVTIPRKWNWGPGARFHSAGGVVTHPSPVSVGHGEGREANEAGMDGATTDLIYYLTFRYHEQRCWCSLSSFPPAKRDEAGPPPPRGGGQQTVDVPQPPLPAEKYFSFLFGKHAIDCRIRRGGENKMCRPRGHLQQGRKVACMPSLPVRRVGILWRG